MADMDDGAGSPNSRCIKMITPGSGRDRKATTIRPDVERVWLSARMHDTDGLYHSEYS